MTFKNLFIEHDLAPEVRQWLEEEIAEQEERFKLIEKEMQDLAPTREKWYQEFFDRITTIGFNVDGDDKMKISPADLPVKPKGREDRVVWKHGVDSD
ncbi:MAG: hypothetical protein KDI21_10390 [Halieaceae bacterium]|jgi:hypothetical protein|nr:hypothetical protein [Halieaceae bacterium]